MSGRIRLTVLGGFLGSGKTTWLRHQLHVGVFGRAHVIINEAAETAVDDALLGAADGLTVLSGGSADGVGKPHLVQALRDLSDTRSRIGSEGPRLQSIVLETSGIADPAPIASAIREDPVLIHHVVVDRIVVAVDALNGLTLLTTEPLGRPQVEAADELVLTKIDEVDPKTLARLLATLRAVNPGARISAAIRGESAPLLDIPSVAPAALPPTGPAAQPIFSTCLSISSGTDWTAFTLWLSALLHAHGDDLVRVKGVLRTPAGRLLLQAVRRVVQQPEILPDGVGHSREDGTIVFIGRGHRLEDLEKSLRSFVGGASADRDA